MNEGDAALNPIENPHWFHFLVRLKNNDQKERHRVVLLTTSILIRDNKKHQIFSVF